MNVSPERAERILQELQRRGGVRVDDLARRCRVSSATIRRDLMELESHGMLRRTHGGAIPIEPLLYEPFMHDSSFQEQINRHADEKRRIAAAAAALIRNGDTIALTAGTTTTCITRCLHHHSNITVVTNTVSVAMELSKRQDINVVVTGGSLRGGWFSLVGETAIAAMRTIFVDVVFIGVNGIDAARGLTAHHPDEAAINRVMVEQAKRKIAVADCSKLGEVARSLICNTKDIDVLITDKRAAARDLKPFKSLDVEVVTV